MKIVTLKIERRFYDMIKKGTKNYDYRKTNKDIKVGDVIRFVSVDKRTVFCYKEVDLVREVIIGNAINEVSRDLSVDIDGEVETLKFILDNYMKEKTILKIGLSLVETNKTILVERLNDTINNAYKAMEVLEN